MNAGEIERALWELAEGTIAPHERAEIEAYIAEHPQAASRLERIRTVSQLLASTPEVAPPEELQRAIEQALAALPQPQKRSRAWRATVRELLAPRWPVRLAWLAAGAAVAIVVISLMLSEHGRSAGRDVSKFYGALNGQGAAAVLVVDLPSLAGRLEVRKESAAMLFTLTAQRLVEGAELVLEGEGLTVQGYRESRLAASDLSTSEGRVAVVFEGGGEGEVRLRVSSRGGPVRATVSASGAVIFDRTFAPGQV